MLMVGLNPSDQECVDIPNEWARKGLLYFPDFCDVVLDGFRPSKEEEEDFYQHTFKVLSHKITSSVNINANVHLITSRLYAVQIHSQWIEGPKNTSLAIIKFQR